MSVRAPPLTELKTPEVHRKTADGGCSLIDWTPPSEGSASSQVVSAVHRRGVNGGQFVRIPDAPDAERKLHSELLSFATRSPSVSADDVVRMKFGNPCVTGVPHKQPQGLSCTRHPHCPHSK